MLNFNAVNLRRVTTSQRYIPEVDGIRFMAITWVVLYHIQGYLRAKTGQDLPFSNLLIAGHLGVPIFFVLSGFILGMPFTSAADGKRNSVNIKSFYLRRLTRLEPPYIIACSLCFILLGLHGRWVPENYIASLFYSHNIVFQSNSALNTVLWSLEVEAQFYLLVPLLALMLRLNKPKRFVYLGLVAFSFALISYYLRVNAVKVVTLLNYGQYFVLGLILTILPKSKPHWSLDLMGAICFLLILQFYNNKLVYAFALPVLILGLFYAILNGISLRAVASFPPVAIIGGMCYSIYLLHYPVIAMAGPFLRNIPNPVLTACILCMVILAISTTFFCFIERPTMNPGWPKTLALRVKNRLTQKPANPKQDRLRENELPVQIKN